MTYNVFSKGLKKMKLFFKWKTLIYPRDRFLKHKGKCTH